MKPQYIYINEDGDKFYYNDKAMKILHREDGPAIEYADGSKEWYLNGKRHREDGPAIEYADGSKEWYLNGKRHREDGPALEYRGNKYWYLSNVYYSEQDFLKLTDKETILTMDEIAAKFGIEVSKLKIQK
jgi:hypothetical protein